METKQKSIPVHEPVLTKEVIDLLKVKDFAHLNTQARFVDATLGAAGHAIEIVKSGGEVLGIDQDPKMLKIAKKNLEDACPTPNRTVRSSYKLIHGNFREIDKLARQSGYDEVDGILFDLGISNIHLTSTSRGFSFQTKLAPLDMRLDPKAMGVTASDLLNSLPKDKLFKLFESVLPFKQARSLSNRIMARRLEGSIATVGDFSDLVKSKAPGKAIDVNTLPFMALRMAVNSELENLSDALPKSFDLLKRGGRLIVISFHSGEDKIVKKIFKELVDEGKAKMITKKPVRPSDQEIKRNSKSRSAKMRVLEKL